MAKNAKKSEAEDHSEALKQETDKISGKIDDAFDKLAKKFRTKSDNAKSKVGEMKHKTRRAVLLRRFELYGDAANYIEDRLAHKKDISDNSDD